MEGPGKLNDIFESYGEESNDTQLQWSAMGPKITDALKAKEEKRKKRLFWWWLSGFGAVVIGAIILFFAFDISDKDTSMASTYAADVIQLDISESRSTTSEEDRLLKAKMVSNYNKEDKIGAKEQSKIIENSKDIVSDRKTANGISKEIESRIISGNNNSISNNSSSAKPRTGLIAIAEMSNATSQDPNFSTSIIQNTIIVGEGVIDASSVQKQIRDIDNFDKLKNRYYFLIPADREIKKLNGEYINIVSQSNMDRHSVSAIYIHGGINFNDIHQLYDNSTALQGSSVEVGYQKSLSESLYISLGIACEQNRFQTAFVQSEEVELFRPETVDTIYDYGFGNEAYILTDFIDGTRVRSFGNTNTLNTLSIPIQLGYRFSLAKLSLAPEMGIAFTINQRKDFRIANSKFEVTDGNSSSTLSMYPLLRGGVAIEWPLWSDIYLSSRYYISTQSIHDSGGLDRETAMVQGVQLGVTYRMR